MSDDDERGQGPGAQHEDLAAGSLNNLSKGGADLHEPEAFRVRHPECANGTIRQGHEAP